MSGSRALWRGARALWLARRVSIALPLVLDSRVNLPLNLLLHV